jgi:hypothetical protein
VSISESGTQVIQKKEGKILEVVGNTIRVYQVSSMEFPPARPGLGFAARQVSAKLV